MPREYPEEFKRDVVAVERSGCASRPCPCQTGVRSRNLDPGELFRNLPQPRRGVHVD